MPMIVDMASELPPGEGAGREETLGAAEAAAPALGGSTVRRFWQW